MRNALWIVSLTLGLIGSSASLFACADDDSSADEAQTSEDASTPSNAGKTGASSAGRSGSSSAGRSGSDAAAGTSSAAGTRASGGAGSAGMDAGTGPRVVAGDIASVLHTVNVGEIDIASLALRRAATTLARDYAQTMVNEHSHAEERQSALFGSLDVIPTDNALSAQLQQEARRSLMAVERLAPGEFDLAYARSQVEMHGSVLRLLDETLVPSATQQPVRNELLLTRAEVQRHLTLAMTLVSAIQYTADVDAGSADAGW